MIPPHLVQQVSLALADMKHGCGYIYDKGSGIGVLFHSPTSLPVSDTMIIVASVMLNTVLSGKIEEFTETPEEFLKSLDLSGQKPT